jgi:hypothetical protein
VRLKNLKENPRSVMDEICDFLGIRYGSSMEALTLLGQPFGGHFHDRELNTSRIQKTDSKYDPLSDLEQQYLKMIGRFTEGKRKGEESQKLNIWHEIQRLLQKETSLNFIQKVLVLLYLLEVHFKFYNVILKNDLSDWNYFKGYKRVKLL